MTEQERIQQAEAIHNIIQAILSELYRAEHLHPVWPGVGQRGDHVRAAAKLGEEYGELVQAVNNYDEGKGSVEHIRREAVQTGAMVLRFLKNLDAVEWQRINEDARQDLQEEHNVYTDEAIFTGYLQPNERLYTVEGTGNSATNTAKAKDFNAANWWAEEPRYRLDDYTGEMVE